MMPLSICARTMAGLTTGPQSMAQVTRLTCSVLPSVTATSATCATIEPNEARNAMPRPDPAGSGWPQPASLAAVSSTFRCRGLPANKFAAELERVLLQGQRQLVDEALVEEGGVRMADRAPEADRHRAVGDDGLEPVERKGVGRILDGIALGLALRRQADRRARRNWSVGDCATWRLATLASLGAPPDMSSSARQRASAIGR